MRLFYIMAAACSLLLAGCMSYQVKDPGDVPYATVYVSPIVNASTFPLLEASLTSAIRNEVNNTGMLATESEAQADAQLEVTVRDVTREMAAVQESDVGRGRKFVLIFDITCDLYRGPDRQAVFTNRNILVRQDVFAEVSQVNAEFLATPEASRKIAERIANLLTDVW